jgi:hypothetical protein
MIGPTIAPGSGSAHAVPAISPHTATTAHALRILHNYTLFAAVPTRRLP